MTYTFLILGEFNNWLRDANPDLTERSCMQYKGNSVTNYGCQPASCDNYAPKLCVTDNKGLKILWSYNPS